MKVFVIPSWHPTVERPLWCNWVLPHIAALRQQGFDVKIIQVDIDSPAPSAGLSDDHLYQWLSVRKGQFHRTRFRFGFILRRYTETLSDLYHTAVKKWGEPDIIHAHVSLPAGYGASVLGARYGVPVVVTEHYTGVESDTRFWWRVGCFYREMARRIAGLYAVSPGYSKRLQQRRIPVTGVIPNPIDTNIFTPLEKKPTSNPLRIVTAGNLCWGKGTDVLFNALSIIAEKIDWQLTVFGEAQDNAIYQRYLNDPVLTRRVRLPGKVSQVELSLFFASSDLYVVSSRMETANVSMLQALACGIPVVSTLCGASETLLDPSISILVPVGNPEALAKGILEMAGRLSDYPAEKLRGFVEENYSLKAVGSKMAAIYTGALNSGNVNERVRKNNGLMQHA